MKTHYLLSIILTLVLCTVTLHAEELHNGYTKVTDITTLQESDKVVLYCDAQSIGVTGWNGAKDATVSTSNWAEYTVEKATNGVRLKHNDQYIYLGTKNTFVHDASKSSECFVTVDGIFYSVLDKVNYYLYENASDGTNKYYRMYTDKSTNSSYHPFYLYKVVDEPLTAHDITIKARVPAFWRGDITVWVWDDGGEGFEFTPTREGDFYVYTHHGTYLNIIFKNGTGWSGDTYQTEDMYFTESTCIQINQSGTTKATYTIIDCETGLPTISLAGDMNNWNTDSCYFQPAPDSLTATATIRLKSDTTYEFKIVKNLTQWYTNPTTIYRYNAHTPLVLSNIEGANNNISLTTDAAGEYLFTWDYANQTLSVHYPTIEGIEQEWEILTTVSQAFVASGGSTPWDLSCGVDAISTLSGITMKNGHITEIRLQNKKLKTNFPAQLLLLPYLETLYLYSCELTGDMFAAVREQMQAHINLHPDFASPLKSITVSRNYLWGNVGELEHWKTQFPALKSFTAPYCAFGELYPALTNITTLSMKYQDIDLIIPNVDISNDAIDTIPTLLRYDHANHTYKTSTTIGYIGSNNFGMTANKTSNTVGLFTYNNGDSYRNNIFKGQRGDTLQVYYYNGAQHVQWGYFYCTIDFEDGDVNFLSGIDITDVQSTINYMFNDNSKPYNLTAADVYTDQIINIQDVITTINMILDAPIDNALPYSAPKRSAHETPSDAAQIILQDGVIKLITPAPVSALHITYDGDVQWNLQSLGLDVAQRTNAVIAYSLAGTTIPAGETILGIASSDAQLYQACLSDSSADHIPVQLVRKEVPTDNPNVYSASPSMVIYDLMGRPQSQLSSGVNIVNINGKFVKVYNH